MSKDIHTEREPVTSAEAKRIGLFTPQPFTTLGKVAFWGYLVGTIGGAGGAIAIAITSGAPSRDIIIFTASLLVTTILVATRIRWLQVLAILTGIYVLYQFFTQPFVIESLANPKGPNGGYGHFIGDVVPMGIIIISLVANVGTVLQTYHLVSRKIPRWYTLVLGGVLGLVIGASFIGALAQPPAAAAVTYTNGVPTIHLSPGRFDVTSVTLQKGSKLLLVDDTSEQHLLANGTWQQNAPVPKREQGAPVVNNLSLSGNSVTIGPFVTAGTYHILCLLHRGMELTITVQ